MRAARPRQRDDDLAFPAFVLAARDPALSSPRRLRDGRDGGQIPIKNDAAANDQALARVRADKEREAGVGHDGTWVAHPGLVPVAREIFDRLMPGPNNLERLREDVHVDGADLLKVPDGHVTRAGLRSNIDVGIRYLAAWLGGNGCVPIHHLMEDAATAEISRAQLWQWVRHATPIEDGTAVTLQTVRDEAQSVLAEIRRETGDVAFDAGTMGVPRAARPADRQPEFEPFDASRIRRHRLNREHP